MKSKIKTLLTWLAVLFGVAVFDGMAGLGIDDSIYSIIGLAEIGIIIALFIQVNKLQE
jgi:hypothetical protein